MFEAIIFYFRPVSHSFKVSNTLQCYLFLECLCYVVVFLFYLASASIYFILERIDCFHDIFFCYHLLTNNICINKYGLTYQRDRDEM